MLLPLCAAILTAPCFVVPAPESAADTVERPAVERPTWTLRLSQRQESSDGDAQERGFTRIGLTRHIGRAAVIGEVVRVREPQGASVGGGVEVYTPLWQLAEGHARVAGSVDALSLPGTLVGVEVIQHMRSGWHASVAAEHRRYDQLEVQRYLAGVGWSSEAWFIRSRAGMIEAGDPLAVGQVIIRRILQDGSGRLEVAASAGGDVLDVLEAPEGRRILTATTRMITAGAEFAVYSNAAIGGELGYSAFGRFGGRSHLQLTVLFVR